MLFTGLFDGGLQLSGTIKAITGFIVIQKHKMFGFHRLGAMVLAKVLTRILLLLVQCFLSSVIM
jgi:hypothetical protein